MGRILERHDDVGTVGFMLYADSNDKLYSDSDLKKPLTAEDVSNAFVKGCVVSKDGVLSRPTALNADGTLSYGAGGGQKLYRHDVTLSAGWGSYIFDIHFNLYNNDPTDYSKDGLVYVDEEQSDIDWENSFTLTVDDLAFIPLSDLIVSGELCYADGTCLPDICTISRTRDGICVGYALGVGYLTFEQVSARDVEQIWDYVTEVM